MTLDQYILGLLGVTAILMSQNADEKCRKWAPVFGLLSQPFFFYTAWIHGQWGLFGLSVFYTMAWAKGFHTYWLRRAAA